MSHSHMWCHRLQCHVILGTDGEHCYMTWDTRVGWWISEHSASMAKWKILCISSAVWKDFSQNSISWKVFDFKKLPKKQENPFISSKSKNWKKIIEFRPPLFFNFRGGYTSSTFSSSCSFLRYAFLGLKFTFQNNDFWEKSFYYSSFYTKKLSFGHWSTIFWENRPTLLVQWWSIFTTITSKYTGQYNVQHNIL